MQLSVIVPVFNEAAAMHALLPHLLDLQNQGAEVLLVDGGSQDETLGRIEQSGLRCISSPTGRARQMNAAALHSHGEVLVFLHADSQLPLAGIEQIRFSLDQGFAWGRFDVRIAGRSGMLHIIAWMMNQRSRLTGIATGDQAIFMTRTAFNAVGGFPDQPLMEDIEISKRLLRQSRPACIADKVTTSGRRWERHGVWKTVFLMWRLRYAYWRGQSADHLAKAYQ
jgi:rSAM/selenodomain-associated transferase 2